jgi:hypothetical protein
VICDQFECGPFGRNLSLLVHRLPRRSGADWDWELERGFHLEVLSDSLFELNLRPRARSADGVATLPILSSSHSTGLSKLLVWQKCAQDEDGWVEFAQTLAADKPWQAGLILSASAERGPAVSSYLKRRAHWSGLNCPVVQIFQDSPAPAFFTVEKNLFSLGRVGRRMERYAGVRRWLPW